MKAIKDIFINNKRITILHQNVIEIKGVGNNKRFKCLNCGEKWIQTINSPLIIEDETILNNPKNYWTTNLTNCTNI